MRAATASVEIIANIQKYVAAVGEMPGVTKKQVATANLWAEREMTKARADMIRASERAAAIAEKAAVKSASRAATAAGAAALDASKPLMDRLGDTFGSAFKSLIAADVATEAFAWVKSAITDVVDLRNTILTMSDATGIGVDTLSAIEVASKRAGVEFNAVADVFEDFAGSVVQFARDGSGKGANAFRELGVNVKDAGGQLRNTDDVLREFIGKVQKIGSETQRSGLLVETFSDKAGQLQRVLGSVNIEDLVAASERFGVTSSASADATRDWAAATGSLSLALRAMVTDVIEGLTGSKITDSINRFAAGFIATWTFASSFISTTAGNIGHVIKAMNAEWGSGEATKELSQLTTFTDAYANALDDAQDAANDLFTLQKSGLSAGPTAAGPALRDKAAEKKSADDRKRLREEEAKRAADAAQGLADILSASTLTVMSESDKIVEQYGRQIDEIARLEALSGDHATAEAARHAALRVMLTDTATLEAQLAAKAQEERDKATQAQIDAMIEIAKHRKEDLDRVAEEQAVRLQNERTIQNAIFDVSQTALSSIASIIQENAADTKSAQLRAFAATKAITVAQIALSTAAAIANALATPPFPVGAALAVVAGIAGAAQLAAALAAKPQIHHSGKFNAASAGVSGLSGGGDEVPALLQRREVVVSAQAVDRAGGPDGVRRKLDGGGSGAPTVNVVLDMADRRIRAALAADVRGMMSVPALAGWGV